MRDGVVKVNDCKIHFRVWGQAGRPGLLLVHGGFAHAHWWDFIAPMFSQDYFVAAVDLSGMGESGHRRSYSGELFAQEAISICERAGLGQQPLIVGHSFGGYVALQVGAIYGKSLAGVVLADFPVRPPEMQQEYEARRPPSKPKETYPSREAALARFRLIPRQPRPSQFILDHIAAHSLAKVRGGWTWKFDPKVFDGFTLGNLPEQVRKVACPLAIIHGERSDLFSPQVCDYMRGIFGGRAPFIVIKGAYHHLFLDRPFAFVRALRTIFSGWAD